MSPASSPTSLAELPITSLKGVGQAVADKLDSGLGIRCVQDVLFHLPFRYQDRTRLCPIGALQPGREALIAGEVVLAEVVHRGRRSLLVRMADGTGSITLRFFHFNQTQVKQFQRGAHLQCFGEARRGYGMLEMVHPEYRIKRAEDEGVSLNDSLTAFYPATEGVQQPTLRKLSDQALLLLESHALSDWMPSSLMQDLGLPDLASALRIVHRPPPSADVEALQEGLHPASRRACTGRTGGTSPRAQTAASARPTGAGPLIRPAGKQVSQLMDSLSFSLTGAQQRVLDEVLTDMGSVEPMLRLVQGDVGSGKTIVAALAAAQAVEAGYQVALMAPTEILAEQHLLNFVQWFEPLGIEVGWLTGKLRASARRSAIEAVAMGRMRVVVGTHALFQKDVVFENLGLAIIDEQHRFGVHQRMALRNKGASDVVAETSESEQADLLKTGNDTTERGDTILPHQLIMTATPIPRTLAMTAYADLDASVIDELPPGRKPVKTVALDSERRGDVVKRVSVAIAEGRQVYWVCTLIEESEMLQAEAAEDTVANLTEWLPEHKVGLVHGRMKPREKEAVMQSFKAREIDLLVATTVIEVGVDVPNASLMIIENAERLGLSQLHQLRGRVGRGSAESSCILMYQSPLSNNARQRIGIMRDTNDGFLIAEQDLELRGAGEVLGTRQTGLAEFRIARLGRDDDLLDDVCDLADALLAGYPDSVTGLVGRWIRSRQERLRCGVISILF